MLRSPKNPNISHDYFHIVKKRTKQLYFIIVIPWGKMAVSKFLLQQLKFRIMLRKLKKKTKKPDWWNDLKY